MMFNLENDTGDRVSCYVVPDAFTSIPSIRVFGGGKELLTLSANSTRLAILNAGRHETGRCGFSITSIAIPNLAAIEDLSIYDAETGILIYRRPRPAEIQKKVLRLETHLLPLWKLDDALESSFQYFGKGIERFGAETVTQLFLLAKVPSIYLSGRILFKNYSYFIEDGFKLVLTIQDPFEELAERLLVLSQARRLKTDFINLRDSVGLRDVIVFAEELVGDGAKLDDLATLRRKMRQMPAAVAANLSNPITRELTAAGPDELPGRNSIASALDVLSSVAVLGLRKESDIFLTSLAAFLEIEANTLPSLQQLRNVPVFAAALRESGLAAMILEKDLELYQYVVDACHKVKLAVGS
jgi:hypothetical protein